MAQVCLDVRMHAPSTDSVGMAAGGPFDRYRGTAVCMCDVMRTVGGAHPSYDASSAIYIYIYIIWHQLCL